MAFLGADSNDKPASARKVLAGHAVSYPSYSTTPSALGSLANIEGMPTTIFINRRGKVVHVQTGEYQSLDALENDIGQYGLGFKAADRPNAK